MPFLPGSAKYTQDRGECDRVQSPKKQPATPERKAEIVSQTTQDRSGTSDRSQSPPVPALLKKIQRRRGEEVVEKHEWEDDAESECKLSKDLQNVQLRDTTGDSQRDRDDLLFQLSLLKKVIKKKHLISKLSNSMNNSIKYRAWNRGKLISTQSPLHLPFWNDTHLVPKTLKGNNTDF